MSETITTITLELLRHGPAHNQLLSPLTQYLGLCGDLGATTVRVPYEHAEFVSHLNALRYEAGAGRDLEQRLIQLDKSGVDMARILGSVPGFISALGADGRKTGIVNVNLVLSAAELSMLPFELSKVPAGSTGGEGNWLLLQTRLPITLTRQVRSVANRDMSWPRKPRILFIVAEPRGMRVPAQSHAQALVKVLEPWIFVDSPNRDEDRKELTNYLTIVQDATAEKIQAACAASHFTHVHILAHGMEDTKRPGAPYGLALQSTKDEDGIEVVDGERLASLLCSLGSGDSGSNDPRCNARRPSVVTIASCDSGNVHSVIHSSGASLAHDLHRAGIPLVVASQFPLSTAGSVHLPKTLYRDLLWGDDPRCALVRLRGLLHALSPDTHDWASLVAYAALPDNFEDQLRDVRYERAKAAIDAALGPIDNMLDELANEAMLESLAADQARAKRLKERVVRADSAMSRMPVTGGYETEGTGIKASTEKRKAQGYFGIALLSAEEALREKHLDLSLASLDTSLELYSSAYRTNMRESPERVPRRSVHWVLSQYLSLRAVLGKPFQLGHWHAATLSAEIDLQEASGTAVVWPHGTLAEMHLILLAYPEEDLPMSHEDAIKQIEKHARRLLERAYPGAFAVQSTRRQFLRYASWWGHEEFVNALERRECQRPRDWSEPEGIIDLAKTVIKMFPNPKP